MMMWLDDEGLEARFLIHKRDTKFSRGVDNFLRSAGIQFVRTPVLAPDANAFPETWIGRFKHACLDHFLCFSLGHLHHIGQDYVRFYNQHRPHQGLGNRTLPAAATGPPQKPNVSGTWTAVRQGFNKPPRTPMAYVAGVLSADCCAITTATQLDGIAIPLLVLRRAAATIPHRILDAGPVPARLPGHHLPSDSSTTLPKAIKQGRYILDPLSWTCAPARLRLTICACGQTIPSHSSRNTDESGIRSKANDTAY